MIFTCPHCSTQVAPTAGTCPRCSKPMVRSCPHCSEKIAVNATACKYCGEQAGAPAAGITFVEETPPRRKCCSAGRWFAALLVAGTLAAGFWLKADCVACVKSEAHTTSTIALSSACTGKSHCARKVCRDHKTPLWVSLYEKYSGRLCCEKKVKSAPAPEKKDQLY